MDIAGPIIATFLFPLVIFLGFAGLVLTITGGIKKIRPMLIGGISALVLFVGLSVFGIIKLVSALSHAKDIVVDMAEESPIKNIRNQNIRRKARDARDAASELSGVVKKGAIDLASIPRDVLNTDNRYFLLEEKNENTMLLKSWSDPAAPDSFYTYFGYADWWRLPLVYPYSLRILTRPTAEAALVEEKKGLSVKEYNIARHKLSGITRFTFDQNWLLAELSDRDGRLNYVLFNFKSQETQHYPTEGDLMYAAGKAGFALNWPMMRPAEYDRMFF